MNTGMDAGDAASDALVPGETLAFHLVGFADPTSFELRADGTFRWITNGCDYLRGDFGRWVVEEGTKVLLPWSGKETFYWPGDFGTEPRARVRLRGDRDEVTTEFDVDGGTYHHLWRSGALCSQCRGGRTESGGYILGPTGKDECVDPLRGLFLPPDAGA